MLQQFAGRQRPGIAITLALLAVTVILSIPEADARRLFTTSAEPAVNSSDLAQTGSQALVAAQALDPRASVSIQPGQPQTELPAAAAAATAVASPDPSAAVVTAATPSITNTSQGMPYSQLTYGRRVTYVLGLYKTRALVWPT
jgi:hypothetical protein